MKKVALSSGGLGLQLILTRLASIHSTWGPCGFYLIPFIFSLPSSSAKLAYFLNTAGVFSLCPFLVSSRPHHPHFYQGFCQVSPPSPETLELLVCSSHSCGAGTFDNESHSRI